MPTREAPFSEEELRAELLKRIDQMCLMDDDLFSQALDGRVAAVGYIVNTILERDDIRIVSTKSQVEHHSTSHRSVKLDIEARDAEGRVLDIEIQRSDQGSGVKRARFHSSMLDQTMLKKGQDFEELAESYVIFIAEDDKFKAGLPVYHADRTIRELDHAPLGDGTHIVYVNGEFQDLAHPIGQLMHDFHQTKADAIKSPLLAREVRYTKESEGGVGNMCKAMEDICDVYESWGIKKGMAQGMKKGISQGMTQGMAKGRADTCLENARKMLIRGKLTHEEIAEYSGLPMKKVSELAKSLAL